MSTYPYPYIHTHIDLFTLRGNGTGTGTGNGADTKGDNGPVPVHVSEQCEHLYNVVGLFALDPIPCTCPDLHPVNCE